MNYDRITANASLKALIGVAATLHLQAQHQSGPQQQPMTDCPMMKEHGMAAMNERGGRVSISSDDAQAVAAAQSFLRLQIAEHKTGDPLEVNNSL